MGKFLIMWCEIFLGFHSPKIIQIGSIKIDNLSG